MEREIILENYLPEFMREIKEMQIIMKGITPNIEKLYTAMEWTINTNYIKRCDEKGIIYYEKMLGITVNPRHNLEDRKFVVLSYFNAQIPYTKISLLDNLKTLCGEGCYKVSYPEPGVIKIRIGLEAKNMYEQVEKMLVKVLPANLVIDYGILWNQYFVLGKYTHKDLEQLTHREIREEVFG